MKYLLIAMILLLSACTENQRARTWGGTTTVKLPAGYKLMNATWKQDNLWYLVDKADSSYEPSEKVFYEDSSFGLMNGKVVFIESK